MTLLPGSSVQSAQLVSAFVSVVSHFNDVKLLRGNAVFQRRSAERPARRELWALSAGALVRLGGAETWFTVRCVQRETTRLRPAPRRRRFQRLRQEPSHAARTNPTSGLSAHVLGRVPEDVRASKSAASELRSVRDHSVASPVPRLAHPACTRPGVDSTPCESIPGSRIEILRR